MGKMMTKSQTIDTLAKKTGLPKKQMGGVLDTLASLAAKEAERCCGLDVHKETVAP